MAAFVAVLKAVRLSIRRDLGTFLSIRFNNLFLFAVLLAYTSAISGMRPIASIPFFLLLLLIILFPLSSDPLSRIPPTRTVLWPLTKRQWMALRIASLGLSPILWLALLIFLLTRRFVFALLFLLAAATVHGLSFLGARLTSKLPQFNPYRHIPQFPGCLGGLVRHNIREILSILDFYAALLLSVGTLLYRFVGYHPVNEAYPALAMMAALALSTWTQCCFGLDFASGFTRYKLLPLRGWQVLATKDTAFIIILLILILPAGSGILAGLTFGFVVIASGRYPSLALRLPLQRWRFASGDLRFTVLQFVIAPTSGFAANRTSPWFLGVAVALYLISLAWGGWYFEKFLAEHAE